MTKNNWLELRGNQADRKSRKNKANYFGSQFTRDRLEHDYQPKVKLFKNKFYKTEDGEKKKLQRIELQKLQEKTINKTLECLKKGETIQIDWDARSHFRNSQAHIKLPRINTQPTNTQHLDHQRPRVERSSLFNNTLQNRSTKSVKNRLIQEKHQKLSQLLFPAKIIPKNTFRSQQDIGKISQIHEEYKKSEKQKKSVRSSKQRLSNKFETIRINGFEGSEKCLSIENINEEEIQFNFQEVRARTDDVQSLKQSIASLSKSQTDKQKRPNKQGNLNKQKSAKPNVQKDNPQTANQARQNQDYDILKDSSIYLLISKSRERIISFKQRVSINNMSNLQRFQYLQGKKNQDEKEQNVQKLRAISNSVILSGQQASKEQIVRKMNQKRKQNLLKLAKFSRVLTQAQEYLKRNLQVSPKEQLHKMPYLQNCQNAADDDTQTKQEQSQRIVKRIKGQSIIKAQERLLARVNLTFLNQDLSIKFQQIRNCRRPPKSVI